MLKVILEEPDDLNIVDGYFNCTKCGRALYFTLVNNKIRMCLAPKCICGETIPLIESLLRWEDVRARYHRSDPTL